MNIEYYKFDFDECVVIRYERDGECNGCGLCCKYLIRFEGEERGFGKANPVTGWDPRNGDLRLYQGGITNAVVVNGKWRYFRNVEIMGEYQPCRRLTDDNKCKIHMGKHLLSRAWPMSPEQASEFPECSYSFREVERKTMDEWWGEGWDKAA